MYVNSTMGMNKIKYVELDSLLSLPKTGVVNFFIDGHSLLRFLYKEIIQADIASSPSELITNVVNSTLSVIEHYRRYFYNRGKDNNFYFLFNRKLPVFQNKILPFGNNYYDKYSQANQTYIVTNHIIDEAMKYLSDVLKYIPDAYCVDNEGVLDVFAIKHIIDTNEGFNIIMTKNELMYQLVSDNTVILRPKKDHHSVINKDNFMKKITEDFAFVPKFMDYTLYPFVIIINGLKDMDIYPINSKFIKLLKLLDTLVEEEVIDNGMSSKSFIKIFNEVTLGNEKNEELLKDRYTALICKNGAIIDKSSIERINYSISINLYDTNSLEKLNEYFDADNKIDIYTLFRSRRGSTKNINW